MTFLAALSLFGTAIYWIREGRDFLIDPYLVGQYIGQLRVEDCFLISTLTTFIFLGLTCLIAYRRLPPDPEIVKMSVKIGGALAALRETQESTAIELSESLENNITTNERLFRKTNTNLEKVRVETMDMLEEQGKAIRKVRRDMLSTIETKIGKTREEMLGMLKKHGTAMQEVGRLSKQGAAAVKKQRLELEAIRTRMEEIEGALMFPQPRLKSQDNPEQIKGVGPRLGKELKSIGITNVGEFIMADPTVIYEKTYVSRETAGRLLAIAQLLMVPNVNERDAELLLEAGVTSRGELAVQDLVSLSRKIGDIARTHVEEGKMSEDEKPTLEEISSWIKMAKP